MASDTSVSSMRIQSSLRLRNLQESEENRQDAEALYTRIQQAVKDIPIALSESDIHKLRDITILTLDRALKTCILEKFNDKQDLLNTLEKVIIEAVNQGVLQKGSSLQGGMVVYREDQKPPLLITLRTGISPNVKQFFLYCGHDQAKSGEFKLEKVLTGQEVSELRKSNQAGRSDKEDAKSSEEIIAEARYLGDQIKDQQALLNNPEVFKRRAQEIEAHLRQAMARIRSQRSNQ